MEELMLWFIGIVAANPTGFMILTVIGTIVVLMTILAPIIVKLTYWTDKDDKVWAWLEEHIVFKTILKIFGSFSVYNPDKIKKLKLNVEIKDQL